MFSVHALLKMLFSNGCCLLLDLANKSNLGKNGMYGKGLLLSELGAYRRGNDALGK